MDYEALLKYQQVIENINQIYIAIPKHEFFIKYKNKKDNVKKCETIFDELEKVKKNLDKNLPVIQKYIDKTSKLYETTSEKIKNTFDSVLVDDYSKKIEEEFERIKVYENSIIEDIEKCEKLLNNYEGIAKRYLELTNELNEDNLKYTDLQKQIKAKILSLEKEKAEVEKLIPKDQLNIFKNKQTEQEADKKFITVLKVIKYKNGVSTFNCPHCTINIDNDLSKKMLAGEIIECGSCRKLIVGKKNE